MSIPTVTIAIPTCNRASLLKVSLESALSQDFADYGVTVLDNGSTDDTRSVVESFRDPRVQYIRHETNIGLLRNWRRAIETNQSPYLTVLQDDDVMGSGMVPESVDALERHPTAAFSFAFARSIDINGTPGRLLDVEDLPDQGFMDGLEYLHRIAAGHYWVIRFSTVMLRSSALRAVGSFENHHACDPLDLNLFYRLARKFDITFIKKELASIRAHEGQLSTQRLVLPNGTGKLTQLAERTDVIAYLLQSRRAEDPAYRAWLAERLLHISLRRSELTAQLMPGHNLPWSEQLALAEEEIVRLVPAGCELILVDGNEWGPQGFGDRRVTPFIERDGAYWGPPPDDDTAIQEVERLRRKGAAFIIFGWPAFWWIDHYGGLRDYLYSTARCVVNNSRLLAFEMHG